jgi:hypothetical protein
MALLNQPPARSVIFELVDGAPAPPGNYAAIVYQVIDEFGVEQRKFQSEETELVDQARFVFAARTQDGRTVYAASRPMRISGHPKSLLYKFLTQLMGRTPSYGWDYAELQGTGCVIAVEHKPSRNGSRSYVTVTSVGPLPPGYPPPNIPPAPRGVAPPPAPRSLAPPPAPAPVRPPAPGFVPAPLMPPPMAPPASSPAPGLPPMQGALTPPAPGVPDEPEDDDVPF